MPFGAEFLKNASKEIRVPSTQVDLDQIKALIKRALIEIAKEENYVKPEAVEIYMHGSYANNTNIFFPSNLEVVVELTRTPEYNPDALPHPNFRLYNDYYLETQLQFNPRDFANLLYTKLELLCGGKATRTRQIITLPPSKAIKHTVEITPAFTFNYIDRATADTKPAEFRGILTYDETAQAHLATFPKIHQRNGEMKDTMTRGNFLKMARVFKTLNKLMAREVDHAPVRGYFIQCLLFNVPRNLFIGDDFQTVFYAIFNYLIRARLEKFACQNLVWQLFGHAPEFWSLSEAHNFIKALKKYEKSFPANRTELV